MPHVEERHPSPSSCAALVCFSGNKQLALVIPQRFDCVRVVSACPAIHVPVTLPNAASPSRMAAGKTLHSALGIQLSIEPWTNKKRLWDDNFSQDLQFKRRASTFTASSPQQLFPLPLPACRYFYDQRRLPPLFSPLLSSSADTIITNKQLPIKHPWSLELDASAMCTNADVHPRSGTDPTPGTGAVICCPLGWKSQTFSNTCSSLRRLVADLTILNYQHKNLNVY